MDQWENEFRIFFRKGAFQVFRYPTAEKQWSSYFDPEGAWEKSKMPLGRRILLVQQSVSV